MERKSNVESNTKHNNKMDKKMNNNKHSFITDFEFKIASFCDTVDEYVKLNNIVDKYVDDYKTELSEAEMYISELLSTIDELTERNKNQTELIEHLQTELQADSDAEMDVYSNHIDY